jgi:NodT family efflux transporter outer membrane factor (OMF) lipoprotein
MTTFLIGVGLSATACMVGPNYQRPPVTSPAAFKEPPPPDWKSATPRDLAPRGKWWEIFGDPQLNALEEQVAVSNQSVAQAEAQFRAARAAAWGARAGLFPTVSLAPSATRSRGGTARGATAVVTPGTSTGTGTGTTTPTTPTTPTTTTTTASGNSTVSVYQLPLDISYEIDVWGKVRRQIEAGVATAQATAGDLQTMLLSMQAELAVDYFTLHGLDAQKQLLDSTAAAYQKALDLTTNRYNQGIASGVDVAQAQTQLEQTRAQSIDLGVQRTQLEHAVAVLTGRPPAELTIALAPVAVPPPVIPVALPSELLERRPDVAAAERRAAAANANIGVAVAAYYPTLSLTGGAGFESSAISKLFDWPSRFWSLGASAVETLFDGGARHAASEQAKAQYDAAVALYRQTVLTAFQDVEDNLSALRVLGAEAVQQQAAVTAAERSLALANNRYQGGITTYLEVITAQSAALANERTAVDILTRRMTASVNLVKAVGGGWKTDDLPSGPAILTSTTYSSSANPPAPPAQPPAGSTAPASTQPPA